jgi:nucleotide-binding universal stress UspA family protein
MDKLKRWLVPLRLDKSDESLLAYVSYIASQIEPEAIEFLHITQSHRLPLGFGHHLPQVSRLSAEDKKVEMQLAVYKHFEPKQEFNFEVIKGKKVHTILQETVNFGAGLTFLPWDDETPETQTIARKITRKTCSSVWLVPQGFKPRLQTALIPVDFSIYSHRALRIAMDLTQKGNLKSIYCQHVYLSANYYEDTLVTTLDEVNEREKRILKREKDLRKYFEEELREYLLAFDFNSRYCLQQVDSLDHRRESVYTKINDLARTMEPDLLIMGSRGLTGVNSVMLGGVTDNVLREFAGTPFLVLKRPVENKDLLEALLKR